MEQENTVKVMMKPAETGESMEKIYRVRAVSDGRVIRLPAYVPIGKYFTPQLNPDGSILLIPMTRQKVETIQI